MKEHTNKITTERLREMKQHSQKICCITGYDAAFTKIFDEAGIDLILVGDSVANVFQGKDTTLSVTLSEMIYHTKIVKSVAVRPLIVCDMPFMSYQISSDDALKNAGMLLKETGCDAVKLEGCTDRILKAVEYMNEVGIPVMGHIGLTPQSINKFGTYKVRGKDSVEANRIAEEAIRLEKAGAFAIVLEKIPATLAKQITETISIPTIGIGAGKHCDGQILVCNDMLGLNIDFQPRFVRRYLQLHSIIKEAVNNYADDIRNGNFPNEEESY
jgi:3-methyl-2-oxobutanoate hydroxymethyltransferase